MDFCPRRRPAAKQEVDARCPKLEKKDRSADRQVLLREEKSCLCLVLELAVPVEAGGRPRRRREAGRGRGHAGDGEARRRAPGGDAVPGAGRQEAAEKQGGWWRARLVVFEEELSSSGQEAERLAAELQAERLRRTAERRRRYRRMDAGAVGWEVARLLGKSERPWWRAGRRRAGSRRSLCRDGGDASTRDRFPADDVALLQPALSVCPGRTRPEFYGRTGANDPAATVALRRPAKRVRTRRTRIVDARAYRACPSGRARRGSGQRCESTALPTIRSRATKPHRPITGIPALSATTNQPREGLDPQTIRVLSICDLEPQRVLEYNKDECRRTGHYPVEGLNTMQPDDVCTSVCLFFSFIHTHTHVVS
nr:uncharacterized protein LOC117834138 isoform X2 [Setaria viridis]